MSIFSWWLPLTLLGAMTVSVVAAGQEQPGSPDFKAWGRETLDKIQSALWLPKRGLYAEETVVGQPAPKDKPAFMWGCGVQLSALAAATRLDRAAYLPLLRRYATNLDGYWMESNDIGGYNVLPHASSPDRYYDDNAWIVLAMAETFEITRDKQYLRRAEQTFRFVMSGEDDKLDGGLYWHEKEKTSKNTCSNAPATAAALRLYQLTQKPEYLTTARRLYEWTNTHLQDTDGLFFDHIRLDATLEKTKWSYNTALMIRANVLFYEITKEPKYLTEAQRLAHAAEARWIRPETGAIADGAAFAHLLTESFLFLYEQDKDTHWTELVRRALMFLHENVRDANGFYGEHWDRPQTTPREKITLLSEASAARAFLNAAQAMSR